jgi:hypothetical protein
MVFSSECFSPVSTRVETVEDHEMEDLEDQVRVCLMGEEAWKELFDICCLL